MEEKATAWNQNKINNETKLVWSKHIIQGKRTSENSYKYTQRKNQEGMLFKNRNLQNRKKVKEYILLENKHDFKYNSTEGLNKVFDITEDCISDI